MARLLDQQRYTCGLGAMQTVHAIGRALPILHSGPGCAGRNVGGAGSSGYFSGSIFPCTDISESDVIFGASEKLRNTIENALLVVDADLYVVLTSCSAEIIADDVAEIVGSFKNSAKPVIFASTPGFKFNNYIGYETVISAIVEQYLKPSDKKQKGLVNIWASIPYQDIFWHGNLKQLESLVSALGLTPNTIFGYDRGIENIDLIPQAEFNLLVSPWLGLSNMKQMEEKFGTPFLHYPTLPIGATETSRFLRAVGSYAGVDLAKTERIIERNEKEYYYFIERFADIFLETRVMSKRFVIASDAQNTLAFTKFLVNDLGLVPSKQYVTDGIPEEYQETVRGYFSGLNDGLSAEVDFTDDGAKIHGEIESTDFHGYPLILGTAYEKKLAKKLFAHYLNISWPVFSRVVMHGSYVGYGGGLRFFEELYTEVLTRFN
jgi:nitrogenase molybdenum-iron protein beta chain